MGGMKMDGMEMDVDETQQMIILNMKNGWNGNEKFRILWF
jgi:hypothetical protein